MKLLFDQNISIRMPKLIADVYPGSSHVREHHLHKVDDEIVWSFAKDQGWAIVSKDSDFRQRSFLYGFPPKVIWIKAGNCTTKALEKILRTFQDEIHNFCADKQASFLVLP